MTKTHFDTMAQEESSDSYSRHVPSALMKRLRARIARRPGRWRRRMQTKTHRGQNDGHDLPAAA